MNPIELSRDTIERILALARDAIDHGESSAFVGWLEAQDLYALCTAALRYLKLRDGNVVACYTVPPDDTQPGVRISGPAMDKECDK